MLVQNPEDGSQKVVRPCTLLGVHVQYSNAALDGDSRRSLWRLFAVVQGENIGATAVAEKTWVPRCDVVGMTWVYDGASIAWIHDILDPDRDAGANDLVHGKWMYDFRAIECQF